MEIPRTETTIQEARILIVDDQEANVRLLERILRHAGYTSLTSTTDSREVPSIFTRLKPDLILLDLTMPHVDGFEIMEQLGTLIAVDDFLPILN